MTNCYHLDFAAHVDVHRLFDDSSVDGDHARSHLPDGFVAEVKVQCVDCGEPMVFFGAGLPVGLVRDRPSIDPAGTELRVPLRPQSADPHMGLGLAGFVARVQEGAPGSAN